MNFRPVPATVMTPIITRLPSDGRPWTSYRVTQADDPKRYVTVLTLVRGDKLCIDHTISCLTSLHHWPELFEAWRFPPDSGFELTKAGRELFTEADRAGERQDARAAEEQY